MTYDQLQARDRRIAELDALGRAKSRAERDELASLVNARDHYWRRLPDALERARRKVADLEAHARQHRLLLELDAA